MEFSDMAEMGTVGVVLFILYKAINLIPKPHSRKGGLSDTSVERRAIDREFVHGHISAIRRDTEDTLTISKELQRLHTEVNPASLFQCPKEEMRKLAQISERILAQNQKHELVSKEILNEMKRLPHERGSSS